MKPFTKQTNKWLLSAALIATLGSQYYFSVSSKSFGSFELSSTAADELNMKIKALDNTTELSAIDKAKIEQRKKELIAEYAPKIAAEKSVAAATTEATTIEFNLANCAECAKETVKVTGSPTALTAIASMIVSKEKETVKVAAKADVAKEEVADETPAEKHARLREEAKQKKEDKLRQEKEDRNDAFTEKAEDIADRCEDDLGCKVSRFSALMRNYAGKKKVDQFAVTKAFNQLIDKDLKAGLRGEDGSQAKTAALDAIDALMGTIPSDYKSLKTRTVDTAKAAQVGQATLINGLYKQADVYKSQHRTTDEITTREQAMKAEVVFKQDANSIYQSMYEGLSTVKDQTTMDYVMNNYVPDIRNLISRLSNPTSIGLSDTTQNTATGSRAGRSGNTTIVNRGASPVQNSSNNNLNGVQFGTVSPSRTTNRVGVGVK